MLLEVPGQTAKRIPWSPSGKAHCPPLLHTEWLLQRSLAPGWGHVSAPLTSALLLWVTPVPVLTPGARAAPKPCPAGALTRDLRGESADQSAGTKSLPWERERTRVLRGGVRVPSAPRHTRAHPLPRQPCPGCGQHPYSPWLRASPSLLPPGRTPRPASPPTDPLGFQLLTCYPLLLCVLSQTPHCLQTLTSLPPSPDCHPLLPKGTRTHFRPHVTSG